MLVVDSVNPTVPAYEFVEVTVTAEVPELPWDTVTFVADSVKVPPEEPPLDPPTLTVTEPVEEARVEFPEYVASITCEPDVVDEKV